MNDKYILSIITIVLTLITSILVPTAKFIYELDKRVTLNEYKIQQFNKNL